MKTEEFSITPLERKAIFERLKRDAMDGDAASAAVLLTLGDPVAQRRAVREFKRSAPHHAAREFRG